MIRVLIFQEPDLLREVRITQEYSITLPLIGTIDLRGRTVRQTEEIIRSLYDKDYLVNPQVTITVTEYAKRRFTVLGQVGKPGSYDFPNEDSVTLLQGIGMAGGFTRLAKTSRVTITRTAGTRRTFSVDVRANNDSSTKQLEILPDDIISVDERTF